MVVLIQQDYYHGQAHNHATMIVQDETRTNDVGVNDVRVYKLTPYVNEIKYQDSFRACLDVQ